MSERNEPNSQSSVFRGRNIALIAGIIGGVLLFHFTASSRADFVAADVGLGMNTVSFTQEYDGEFMAGLLADRDALMKTARQRRAAGRPVALWLGASQTYAINHPEPGDHLAVWYAQQRAEKRGSRLSYLQNSTPNGNLNELLCMYLAYRQAELLPDLVILAFTYDDLKEPGIREAAVAGLAPLSREIAALCGPAAEHIAEARKKVGKEEKAQGPVERTATEGTPQEWLEDGLVQGLEEAWPAYSARGSLRSAAITAWKMPLATLMFKLFRRPKTLIPPHLEKWNGAALDALFAMCAHDEVPLFVYKAPHPSDPNIFLHDRAAYDPYHAALAERCRETGNHWLDLESLVAGEHWGRTNNGEPDVFHFTVVGHRLLGEAVDAWMEESGR